MENLYSNFIGPKAENIDALKQLMNIVLDFHANWRKENFAGDESLYRNNFRIDELKKQLQLFLERSKKNLPYFHPRYSAQMLKDPSIPTILGYVAFMMSNPNNHAYEGGPVTTEMEMEVVEMMLEMVGFENGWGHLASGGSLANLEALWAVRDSSQKEIKVFFSEVSHYSWKRICSILRISNYKEIIVDKNFRMDLNELEQELKKSDSSVVIANLGSTGTGSVDDIAAILKLKQQYNFHLHIDAAYGGFARTLLLDEKNILSEFDSSLPVSEFAYRQLKSIQDADSITIDPHKHGLISYGAGAVLYKDENLRNIILNSAPYTYHKLDKPNIGMFSLEGSRPGAMAAACYLTYKVLPLNRSGVGSIINESFSASKKFYELAAKSSVIKNLHEPDLDINCFFIETKHPSITELNMRAQKIYNRLSVEAENPEFILSKFVVPPSVSSRVLPGYSNPNNEFLTCLRSVFMKHWNSQNDYFYIRELIKTLERLAND